MKLDASILDYKEEFGELSCEDDGGASNIGHKSSGLVEDLKGMLNNPEFSDVTFICSDGVHVHGSRMFLAARSTVFKQMFSSGMSETRSSNVPVPSVGSSTLIQVLKFLYTGELEPPLTGVTVEISNSETGGTVEISNAETGGVSDFQSSGNGRKLIMDVSNGMSETRGSIIPLPSIGSSTLIRVLKFLCSEELESSDTGVEFGTSGTGDRSDPRSSGNDLKLMMDVLSAALFLSVYRLVQVTLRRIWDWLCGEATVDGMLSENFMNRLAHGLTILCGYTSSSAEGTQKEAKCIEANCIRMVQVLVSSVMSKLTLSELSKEAFTFYLDKTKNPPSDDEEWKWSLDEYKKLIQLLTWSTIKAGEEAAHGRNLLICLPGLVSAGRFVVDGNETELFGCRPASEVTQNRQRLSSDTVKKYVQELLPFIDLPSVHPELLIQVIKPLKIIDAEVADAVGAQAIRTSRFFRNLKGLGLQPSHNWFITSEERIGAGNTTLGYVVFKMEPNISNDAKRVQTFMANSPMHSYGTYKWRVAAHTPKQYTRVPDGPRGFEFGFLRMYPGEELPTNGLSTTLSSKTGLAMRVTDDLLKIEYRQGTSKAIIWNLKKPFNLKSEVVLLVDRWRSICKVTCNGYEDISVTLKLPEGGLLYPAICLPDPKLAVAIEFLEGFDRHVTYGWNFLQSGELISPQPISAMQFSYSGY